jgi:hypothetical protein
VRAAPSSPPPPPPPPIPSLFCDSKSLGRYKRQLLNALAIIKRYGDLKRASPEERATFVRKTVLFAGKAAPGYFNAKCIIRLICGISEVVNADAETNHYLKVFFVPNYNVTLAEKMIPASDLSQVRAHVHLVSHVTSHPPHHTPHVTHPQHISTAGMEASGTSNMKFIMNGGVIIGTLDGANVEISEQVLRDNVFIFGLKTEQIDTARHSMKCAPRLIVSTAFPSYSCSAGTPACSSRSPSGPRSEILRRELSDPASCAISPTTPPPPNDGTVVAF